MYLRHTVQAKMRHSGSYATSDRGRLQGSDSAVAEGGGDDRRQR